MVYRGFLKQQTQERSDGDILKQDETNDTFAIGLFSEECQGKLALNRKLRWSAESSVIYVTHPSLLGKSLRW